MPISVVGRHLKSLIIHVIRNLIHVVYIKKILFIKKKLTSMFSMSLKGINNLQLSAKEYYW